MKFRCPQCHAKYSIPDEKLRNKVLKIRCKRCEHLMVLRDDGPGQGAGEERSVTVPERAAVRSRSEAGGQESGLRRVPTGQPAPAPPWFLGVSGKQEGPFDDQQVALRIRGGLPSEALAWRHGMARWLPVAEVPELARHARPSEPPRAAPGESPPPATPAVADALKSLLDELDEPLAQGQRPSPLAPLPPRTDTDEEPPTQIGARPDALPAPAQGPSPSPLAEAPADGDAEPLAVLIEAPGGAAIRRFPNLSDLPTEARTSPGRTQPAAAEPLASPDEAPFTSAPPPSAADLSLAAMVVDELGRQAAPLVFPSEEHRRATSGEFSVIVRLRKQNRRHLWISLVGVPLLLALVGGLVLYLHPEWFRTEAAADRPVEPAAQSVVAPSRAAKARPLYDASDTQLRLESSFTMQTEAERAAESPELKARRAARAAARAAARSADPDGGRQHAPRSEGPEVVAASPEQPAPAAPAAPSYAPRDPRLLALLDKMDRGRSSLELKAPAPLVAPPQRREGLSPQDVSRVLASHRNRVTRCLDRELKRGGGLSSSRITLDFTVRPDGHTDRIQLSQKVGSGYFQACVTDVVQRMSFPPFQGEPLKISYPLILTNSGI